MLCGKTSSGKSLASKYLQDKYNFYFLEVSDLVKGMFQDNIGLNIARDNRLLNAVLDIINMHDKIVICGLREEYEIEGIIQKYPQAKLYEIFVPQSIRVQRAKERGMSENDLRAKDNIDERIGVDMVTRKAQTRILNMDLKGFYEQLDEIIKIF
jgi:dephospho-CoA kinase